MSTDNPQTKDSQASEHSSIIARFDPKKADAGVCLFTLGGKRFAIDTTLVGEVVTVSRMLRVPLSPAPVLGLFSLRGTPVAVVDLLAVFAMGSGRPTGDETQVLVLRTGEGVVAGVRIDRLDAVVPSNKGRRTFSETATAHPAIVGFFTPEVGDATSILLGADALVSSLLAVSFTTDPRT